MERPFFSVIMPVYKAERYLLEAAGSVLRQTYKDFELILVDDASPDACGTFCEVLQKKDGRVKALHQAENGGLSRARNAGLDAAQGYYVCFVDADDEISETLLESIHRSLIDNPAQAVMFGMREEYCTADGSVKSVHEIKCPPMALRGDKLRREIIKIEAASLYGYACNKAYELDFINQRKLRFEVVPLIEDIRFNVAFFMQADSLNCLGTAPYHYKKRGGESLTAKFAPNYYALHMERVRLLKEQYQNWGMYDLEVKQTLGAVYVRFVLSALQRNCDKRAHMSHAARKNFVRELMKSEFYRELVPFANPQGKTARTVAALLRSKNETALLALGRAVYTVERRLPFLFARAKQSR
jgi:glycosyltransferase involved in cell wall biosynthesis